MEKPQTPIAQQTERHDCFDFEEDTEQHREEAFHKSDDGDELPYDFPRD